MNLDPDKTLGEAREYARLYRTYDEHDVRRLTVADMVIERFEALDYWLATGGRLPVAWRRGR